MEGLGNIWIRKDVYRGPQYESFVKSKINLLCFFFFFENQKDAYICSCSLLLVQLNVLVVPACLLLNHKFLETSVWPYWSNL